MLFQQKILRMIAQSITFSHIFSIAYKFKRCQEKIIIFYVVKLLN